MHAVALDVTSFTPTRDRESDDDIKKAPPVAGRGLRAWCEVVD
jgi:hypothetical protein